MTAENAAKSIFAEYLSFAPVINSGLLLSVLGLLLRAWLVNRKIGIENRKLTMEENKGLREEFIQEMHAQRDQLTALRDDNEELRSEVRLLRRENDNLREEVRGLHGVIDGLRRQNLGGQLAAQRMVADALPHSPEIENALRRLGNIEGDAGR